jgi:hypothetical protein
MSRGRPAPAAAARRSAPRPRPRAAAATLLLRVACVAAALRAAGATTGPRAGPAGGVIVYPSGGPPAPPRHFLEPYVTGVSSYNGDSFFNGSGAYANRKCAPNAPPAPFSGARGGGAATAPHARGTRGACVRSTPTQCARACVSLPAKQGFRLSRRALSHVCAAVRAAARSTSWDTIYVLVSFSERLTVTGAPVLTLATGSHFEADAAHVAATFVGGGVATSKGFWRNDAPHPLRSGVAPPCRAGGIRSSGASAGGAYPSPSFAYTDAARPWGDAYCVAGATPEARIEESMASALAFAFDVQAGHRTPRLDALNASSLTLPVNASIVGEASGRPARLTLPAPGNPLLVRSLRACAAARAHVHPHTYVRSFAHDACILTLTLSLCCVRRALMARWARCAACPPPPASS